MKQRTEVHQSIIDHSPSQDWLDHLTSPTELADVGICLTCSEENSLRECKNKIEESLLPKDIILSFRSLDRFSKIIIDYELAIQGGRYSWDVTTNGETMPKRAQTIIDSVPSRTFQKGTLDKLKEFTMTFLRPLDFKVESVYATASTEDRVSGEVDHVNLDLFWVAHPLYLGQGLPDKSRSLREAFESSSHVTKVNVKGILNG